MNAPVDNRGFLAQSDAQARAQLEGERIKLDIMAKAVGAMQASYQHALTRGGFPFTGNLFDANFAALCRAAEQFFNVEELGDMADAFEPDGPDPRDVRGVLVCDERGIGPASYGDWS